MVVTAPASSPVAARASARSARTGGPADRPARAVVVPGAGHGADQRPGRGGGGPSRRARSSAATACRQNRAGSLSPASSDSHATGCLPCRAQSASRTVLPYPAGAQTSTSPRARPSSSRAVSRGRGTSSGRGPGRCSLVASKTSRSGAATGESTIADLHRSAPPRSSASPLEGTIASRPAASPRGCPDPAIPLPRPDRFPLPRALQLQTAIADPVGCQKSARPVSCSDAPRVSGRAMMIARVPPSALSDLHPGLRLADPARPLISVEKRGTAGAAARGRRAAPRHSAAPAGLGRPRGPRHADPAPARKAAETQLPLRDNTLHAIPPRPRRSTAAPGTIIPGRRDQEFPQLSDGTSRQGRPILIG